MDLKLTWETHFRPRFFCDTAAATLYEMEPECPYALEIRTLLFNGQCIYLLMFNTVRHNVTTETNVSGTLSLPIYLYYYLPNI